MRLHIEVRGQGPDLVLLHGWAMHGGVFAPLIDALTADWTLHIVDLPGHGLSPRGAGRFTLEACARELVLRTPPALWLGWSLGGSLALHAAIDFPGQVRGLVLLASTPSFVRRADWLHGVEAAVFRRFADDLERDWQTTLERFLALEVHGSERAREELRWLRSAVGARGAPETEALQAGLDILDRCDLRRELTMLDLPTLWLGGSRDRLVPAAALHAAAQLQPGARAEIIAGGGHAPFLGQRDAVLAALGRYVREHGLRP